MRVGIVGGGITGLALHHHLRERGVESVVFEAAEAPGGVIRSERVDGRLLEYGPQRMRLTDGIEALVGDLGLGDELVRADDAPLYVYHDGALRRAPRSVGGAVATDLFSWRGKLRALLEPLAAGPRAGETVGGFLRRSFGHEVADRFAGPLYAGLYASDPDEMPVRHSLARALEHAGVERSVLSTVARALVRGREPPPAVTFEEGLQALPRALYGRHADRIHLGTPVRRVRSAGAGFALETAGGRARVDRVVVTTPSYAAADLLERVAPDAADRLAGLTYNPIAVVHLHADADLEGSGFLVPFDAPLTTLGSTWNASLFGRDGVYTCYLGGAKVRDAVAWPDERLAEVAEVEFARATGREAGAVSVERIRPGMPAYDRSWSALEGVETPDGITLAASYESRAGIPGRVRRAERVAERLAGERVRTRESADASAAVD